MQADLTCWSLDAPADLIFSNSALHWADDHQTLISPWGLPRGCRATGHAPSSACLAEAARAGPWPGALKPLLRPGASPSPDVYRSVLGPVARTLEVWEEEYGQVLGGRDPVLEFVAGSTLRHRLDALDEPERSRFRAESGARLNAAYPRRAGRHRGVPGAPLVRGGGQVGGAPAQGVCDGDHPPGLRGPELTECKSLSVLAGLAGSGMREPAGEWAARGLAAPRSSVTNTPLTPPPREGLQVPHIHPLLFMTAPLSLITLHPPPLPRSSPTRRRPGTKYSVQGKVALTPSREDMGKKRSCSRTLRRLSLVRNDPEMTSLAGAKWWVQT